MKKSILLSIFIIVSHQLIYAQGDNLNTTAVKHFKQYVQIGYNIGGLTPFPLPNTIRKIESFSPGFSPSVDYEVAYRLNKKWNISASLRFDIKGMKITDSVQYFHTLITMDSSNFEGDFTGTNKTICKNAYLTLPITIAYSAKDNWRYKLGIYAAYLVHPSFSGTVSNGYIRKGTSLGEQVNIDTATFNFYDKERKFDWGFTAGVEKRFLKTFAATGQLQWGMRPVFPSAFKGIGFKMTNIFFTLGVKKELFN